MKTVEVDAAVRYNIVIDKGILPKSGDMIKEVTSAERVAVITDDTVDKLYSDIVMKSLSDAGFETFKFVFPHMSDLYLLKPHEFYDRYIAPELGTYLKRYFRNVCMEYMMLLNQMGRMPFPVHKIGTWVGKTGNIDIIAQSTDRRNIVGLCNWDQPQLTSQMCEELYQNMEKAKIRSEHIFLFSATRFEPMLAEHAKTDDRFELIDMNEL